ncbi:PrgI family protein [Actinoplanes sp. NEAU-A12]|uniref:PrgI family protein n=1 Tax=Actinoplanes sandaracinus TaxID=3045177 RepID=A0ABT6WN83_9ACTN|nr:PrgI family protein [Actinoplanes sandaracinus]MDI6101198.1 PrgI family protein [Actinoplanes sandaracinus]
MSRRDDEAPLRARVPADVERADRIAFGLTARQLVILTVTGLVLYAAWTALVRVVPPLVFAACCVPILGAVFFLAVGRRDGISLDRWLLAGLRHRRAQRQLVPSEGPITPAPAWVTTTRGPGNRLPLPAPLRLPAKGITADGLIDLGPDGTTGLVAASTVAFGLRTPAEQNGLVAGFARWLHSLDGAAQILVRAQRVDLTHLGDRLLTRAPSLPHPALEDAARSHVEFLDDLAARHELLHRHVTVAVRSTRSPGNTSHQAAETVRALSGCEVAATVLDPLAAAATLAGALNPAAESSPTRGRPAAEPDESEEL